MEIHEKPAEQGNRDIEIHGRSSSFSVRYSQGYSQRGFESNEEA
jgi:hypothetical protein